MAYNSRNMAKIASANRGQQVFFYTTSDDTFAQVMANAYFDDAGLVHQLLAGNMVIINASDAAGIAFVQSVTTTAGSEDVALKGGFSYDGTNITLDVDLGGTGNLFISNLPTSDPASTGAVYSNSGVLTLSST